MIFDFSLLMASEEKKHTSPDTDEIIKPIGRGSYGKVLLVKHFGEILARKEVKYNPENASTIYDTIHEIEVLKGLYYKNIIELKDYYIDTEKNKIYIYTKYYEKGDLWKIIDEKKEKGEVFSIEVYFYLNLLFIGNDELYDGFNKWIDVSSK